MSHEIPPNILVQDKAGRLLSPPPPLVTHLEIVRDMELRIEIYRLAFLYMSGDSPPRDPGCSSKEGTPRGGGERAYIRFCLVRNRRGGGKIGIWRGLRGWARKGPGSEARWLGGMLQRKVGVGGCAGKLGGRCGSLGEKVYGVWKKAGRRYFFEI